MSHFTTNPSGSVDAGDSLQICMNGDTARANQTISVDLSNGENPPVTDQIKIDLDSSGNGCVEWKVPETGWDVVFINDPGGSAPELQVIVNHPAPSPP